MAAINPDLDFHGIAEGREKLSEIIDAVSSGEIHSFGRRRRKLTLMVPLEPYRRLFTTRAESKLAVLISMHLLPGAPMHLLLPAIEDLEKAPIDHLIPLLSLLTPPSSWPQLTRSHPDPELVIRLKKRHDLARALRKAESSGLIESAQHATSTNDL